MSLNVINVINQIELPLEGGIRLFDWVQTVWFGTLMRSYTDFFDLLS
jgi:hypothetical protein